jgi:hypothetical protein
MISLISGGEGKAGFSPVRGIAGHFFNYLLTISFYFFHTYREPVFGQRAGMQH